MSTLVAVDAVEKHWDATSGLRALTLEVREHELVVVRGRSGTGKSTLLSILAGWCEPDRGAVIWGPPFEGCDVTAWDQVAVVPQVLALMGELSARENVDIALRACGITGAAATERADEVLESLLLTELAGRPPGETSLGQRQRTALAAPSSSSPSSFSRTSPRAIRTRRARGGSSRCCAFAPRSAAACWSRPTRRCSWLPPTASSPSTTTERQVPVSRRA